MRTADDSSVTRSRAIVSPSSSGRPPRARELLSALLTIVTHPLDLDALVSPSATRLSEVVKSLKRPRAHAMYWPSGNVRRVRDEHLDSGETILALQGCRRTGLLVTLGRHSITLWNPEVSSVGYLGVQY